MSRPLYPRVRGSEFLPFIAATLKHLTGRVIVWADIDLPAPAAHIGTTEAVFTIYVFDHAYGRFRCGRRARTQLGCWLGDCDA